MIALLLCFLSGGDVPLSELVASNTKATAYAIPKETPCWITWDAVLVTLQTARIAVYDESGAWKGTYYFKGPWYPKMSVKILLPLDVRTLPVGYYKFTVSVAEVAGVFSNPSDYFWVKKDWDAPAPPTGCKIVY